MLLNRDQCSKQWLIFSLLLICIFSSLNSYAEDADTQAIELIVANKAIKAQQNSQAANISALDRQQASESDMADYETAQRDLPELNHSIIDQSNLLTSSENQLLSQSIRQIYDTGKSQIGLIIVPSTGQEDIFSYAMRAAEKWQLGTAKQDNGLLIVLAVNDRKIQILTGYGLEGVLPDIVLHRIIQNQITPYFKQGQYAQGLKIGIEEIDRILSLDPEVARQAAESLKEQQAEAHRQQQAQENTFGISLFILGIAVFASYIIGRKLSAFGAGIVGTVIGLFNGMGIVMSLLLGFGLFFLVISSIAQLVFQALASSSGGGRGGRGSSSGGGYRGGGGGFGGGGASGSW